MRVTLLGTGAPLSPGRCCLGMLVTADGCEPLLLDTCGGFELARQLVRAGTRADDIRQVVVTHRHLDHAGGMAALILANAPADVHALQDTLDGIGQVKAGCFPEWGADDPGRLAETAARQHAVVPGDVRDVGGFRVSFFAMEHRVPTVAVRVEHGGRAFCYSADGRPGDGLLAAARNVDLFLCDALYAESAGQRWADQCRRLMHPTAREAGLAAREAGVGALACVHTARQADPAEILAEASEAFGGPTTVPDDLAAFDV